MGFVFVFTVYGQSHFKTHRSVLILTAAHQKERNFSLDPLLVPDPRHQLRTLACGSDSRSASCSSPWNNVEEASITRCHLTCATDGVMISGDPYTKNTARGPPCDGDGGHVGPWTPERGWSLQTHRRHSHCGGHELSTEVKDRADNSGP